jgi:two-component system response regulator DesR
MSDGSTKIRVLIADDEGLIRSALAALLRLEGDIDVIAECSNGSGRAAEAKHLPARSRDAGSRRR